MTVTREVRPAEAGDPPHNVSDAETELIGQEASMPEDMPSRGGRSRDLQRQVILARIAAVLPAGERPSRAKVAEIVRRFNADKIPPLNGARKWNMATMYRLLRECGIS
jgi:hypothetical protein